jgi:hypothetical protein
MTLELIKRGVGGKILRGPGWKISRCCCDTGICEILTVNMPSTPGQSGDFVLFFPASYPRNLHIKYLYGSGYLGEGSYNLWIGLTSETSWGANPPVTVAWLPGFDDSFIRASETEQVLYAIGKYADVSLPSGDVYVYVYDSAIDDNTGTLDFLVTSNECEPPDIWYTYTAAYDCGTSSWSMTGASYTLTDPSVTLDIWEDVGMGMYSYTTLSDNVPSFPTAPACVCDWYSEYTCGVGWSEPMMFYCYSGTASGWQVSGTSAYGSFAQGSTPDTPSTPPICTWEYYSSYACPDGPWSAPVYNGGPYTDREPSDWQINTTEAICTTTSATPPATGPAQPPECP